MPPIPKRISRRITPSGRTGGAPVPFDIADTGGEIEARALAAFGADITTTAEAFDELSFRERAADDLLASDNAGIARESAVDSYNQFKEDNEDPKLWSAAAKRIRDDADKTFNQIQFFDPQRKEREKIRHAAEMNHFEAIAKLQVTDVKAKIAVRATTNSFVTAFAIDSSDLAAKEKDLDEALVNEFGSKELVAIEKKKIIGLAEKQKISVLIAQRDFEGARKLAETTIGLEPTEREAQLNIINNAETRAKNKAKTTNEFIQDSASEEMIEQLIKDADSVGQKEFDALPFDEENRILWSEVLNHRTEELKKGNPDPFLISDPIINRAISTQLEQDIKDLPDQTEIISRIGKGITPEEARDFINTIKRRKDKDNTLNKSSVKDIFAYYQDLFEIKAFANLTKEQRKVVEKGGRPILTPEQLADNAKDLLEVKRDFTNWLNANEEGIKSGKITDNDIEVTGREITKGSGGQEEQIVLSLWDKIQLPSAAAIARFLVKTRRDKKLVIQKKQETINKLFEIKPRSEKQFLETIGKLKSVDINKADEYLQKHRDKFGI